MDSSEPPSMTTHLLRNLIAHIITELNDKNVGFGKTKLVKLIYLIDVEYYRRRGTTFSGLEWRFYHYGPYAFVIDTALRELDLDVPQETVTTDTGHRATVFRPNHGLRPRLSEHVSSQSELLLVDRIIRDWGEVELNPLLNHVYFFTEPMKHANRGEILDFSTIQRNQVSPTSGRGVPIPTDILAEYKSRFQETKAKRVRQPLFPTPRFDRVYQESLERMTEEEESHGALTGTIDIPTEAKDRLRDQRDNETGD